jgi:hypothetical protein
MKYAGRLLALICSTVSVIFFMMYVAVLILTYASHFPINKQDVRWTVGLALLSSLSIYLYILLARTGSRS